MRLLHKACTCLHIIYANIDKYTGPKKRARRKKILLEEYPLLTSIIIE